MGLRASLECEDGKVIPLELDRWSEPARPEEERLLGRLEGPVIDIGCGPGRHVSALERRGVMALGIDVSEQALSLARAGGATVLHRSVFDRIPGVGRWRGALLLDGNIGIGGDPRALLTRSRELLYRSGRMVVEVEPPGTPARSFRARVVKDDLASGWFPWASVGVDDIGAIASCCGLFATDSWIDAGRWFGCLEAM